MFLQNSHIRTKAHDVNYKKTLETIALNIWRKSFAP